MKQKKFKLIKCYPYGPELGRIIEWNATAELYFSNPVGYAFNEKDINKYSEFWEEVEKENYEILEFTDITGNIIYYQNKNGDFLSKGGHPFTLEKELAWTKQGRRKISKVKRRSDGEIFTIGDRVRIKKLQYDGSFIISKFYFDCNNGHLLCNGEKSGNGHVNITKIEHCKNSLFTTEDGVAEEWIGKNKKKTLKDYENILLRDYKNVKSTHIYISRGHFFQILKEIEPKLYWTKILQLIADDLHGDWKLEWPNSYILVTIRKEGTKYNNNFEVNAHCGGNEGCVYFKSRELAKKAIELMEDKLDIIFK